MKFEEVSECLQAQIIVVGYCQSSILDDRFRALFKSFTDNA